MWSYCCVDEEFAVVRDLAGELLACHVAHYESGGDVDLGVEAREGNLDDFVSLEVGGVGDGDRGLLGEGGGAGEDGEGYGGDVFHYLCVLMFCSAHYD